MTIQFPPLNPNPFDYLIVHATATTASADWVDADAVDRMHRAKGWSGCGYHAIITRSGELQHGPSFRTRPYSKAGAHVGGCGPGWNKRSIGISMAGGVKEDGRTPENNFTEAQFATLREYIHAAREHFGISMANVIGHRDLIKMTNAAPKACPCFDVRGWLADLPSEQGFEPHDFRDAGPMKTPRSYTVRGGDTLWRISDTYGVPIPVIRQLNRLDGDLIQPGQRLRLIK